METRAPTPARILAMVVFALSCFGLLLYLWLSFGGPIPLEPKGYRVHVSFDQAVTLAEQSDVRISGVPVGKVVGLVPEGGLTRAEIELDERYAPLRSDARAILRSKTLLGEAYVELSPGSRSAPPVPEGGSLPVANVRQTVQLDQVLDSFDPDTRRALRSLIRDSADITDGRGRDISAAAGNAGPLFTDAAGLAGIVDSQEQAVRRLVRDAGTVLHAIGRREGEVRTLVSAGEEVLATTAARERELTATVRALPPFLAELRSTLAVAEVTAADAAPVLGALRPVAPLVEPALREASALAPDLRRTFERLVGIAQSARTALPAATRIVDSARPLVGVLHPLGRQLVPIVDYLGLYRREVITGFANTAAATQATERQSSVGTPLHYLRVIAPFTSEGYVGHTQRAGSNRTNPYLRPGGLLDYADGTPGAFHCENAGNVPLGAAPPCREQAPWTFRGVTAAFPRLEADGP